jgi:hypothetical protein
MKKTIIASAIAAVVAAPAAFADVSISGNVQFEAGEFGGSSDNRVKSDLVFSGSEDLGNGMKAGFTIVHTADDQTEGDTEDKFVTLSGDFGTIKAGNFEMYIESSVTAMAANDASHDVTNEISSGEYTVAASGQTIQFTSPSIQGVQLVAQTADNADSVGIQYSGNGLTVKAATEHNADNDNDVDAFAIEYKIDGLALRAVNVDNGTSAGDKSWFGASYTMGANTIAYGVTDTDDATDGDSTLSLSHALSKQTTAYLVMFNDDSSSTTDSTVVGVKHTF